MEKITHLKNVIPNEIEKKILNLINFTPPSCYAKMTQSEIDILIHQFSKNDISQEQIQNIRSSYVKNKMIKQHKYLLKNTNKIIEDYENKMSILDLSKKYDGSPLNILRIILLKTNSKIKVKKILNNPKLLNSYDLKQYNIAKEYDVYALVNQDENLEKSLLFEKDIETILIKNNIEYRTQEELSVEQKKSHGYAFCTPDFLIQTDLKINNHPIKWIDAKNYYGSNIDFIKNNIKEQTAKYIKNYGMGCIVFKLGFNSNYSLNENILFLSWNSFKEL
jgi:hypothetical protein